MDYPQGEFDTIEQCLGKATYTFQHDTRFSSDAEYDTARPSPSPSPHPPNSEFEPELVSPLVSPLSNEDYEPFDVSITPPPDHNHILTRHNSGLPPTPPTMTSSDVAEAKVDRNSSPGPLFADHVRNALESQKSSFSTSGVENRSPPTPDPSPRARLPTLNIPSPSTSPDASAHTHAKSLGNDADGRSRSDLKPGNGQDRADERFLNTPKASGFKNADVRNAWDPQGLSDQSDRGEARIKNYHMESDTDGERAYERDNPAKSDSDTNQKKPVPGASDDDTTADESPISPTLRKALDHRAAYQRLRKPIQPGDAIKRPDASLLYGSTIPKRLPHVLDRTKAPPRLISEITKTDRNAEEPASSQTHQHPSDSVPVAEPESTPQMDAPSAPEKPLEPVGERRESTPGKALPEKSKYTTVILREFAPSEAPLDLTPPTTAQKESLEENNIVYRIIQEENAKRHSALSDDSVKAVVVTIPDHKRKLRHTKKRESLRGDASMEGNSKRSSSESGHRLKHVRASIGDQDTVSDVFTSPGHMTGSGKTGTRDHKRSESSVHRTPDKGLAKMSARISKFDPGEDGLGYWSAIPSPRLVQHEVDAPAPDAVAIGPDPKPSPRRLRRSLRERRLDRTSLNNDSPEARPRSTDGPVISSNGTPTLRRSSQGKRLETSPEARRVSLDRETQTMSRSLDAKLDLAAEDLTREVRDMRDRTSLNTRLGSSDQTYYTATSPRRKSFDLRHLHPMGTPYSTSQFSIRTEAEVLEARGVEIFSHNNESVLVIQQAAQTGSKPLRIDVPDAAAALSPSFRSQVDKPQDTLDEIGKPTFAVDSPLTNPRAAPEPPVIKFIPPTPNRELERSMDEHEDGPSDPRRTMQRRLSLSQRVRRYSENLIQPLPFGRSGSVRKQGPKRVSTAPEPRPTFLSSFWQPRDFWEEYDSESEPEEFEPLPPGGDTSNVTDKRSFLPRSMSVRMSGFRGTGGFLVGNSLGIDRHGTNVRRHHVIRKTSEEMLRRVAEGRQRRTFSLPFSRGSRIHRVGFAGLGSRVRALRQQRQARALEKRRDKLRGQIGTRVYHDGRG